MSEYMNFLASKAPRPGSVGLSDVPAIGSHLFDYQQSCVEFALQQGRSGLFLDTGLGKTLCELEFATHAAAATNGRALILTPLAVARQIEREAIRFGYNARVIRDQSEARDGISICNYDRLDKLAPEAFGAVVLDESSILKAFAGKTTRALIDTFRGCRFKMSATATPAPNDHMELGQQAEFCEAMAAIEMLSAFFINDTSKASQEWRLKGHAERHFWDWMASWSRMAETPEDLGFDGSNFILPKLNVIRHRAAGDAKPAVGGLFAADISATNMHDVKRQTATARAEVAGDVIHRSIDAWLDGQKRHASKKTESMPCAAPTTRLAGNTESTQRSLTKSQKKTRSKNSTKGSGIGSGSDGPITAQCSIFKTDDAPSAEQQTLAEMADFTSTIATRPDASEGCSVIAAISPSATSTTTQKICEGPHTTSKAEKMPAWVLWCDTNEEQRQIEAVLGDICISIYGSQSPEQKEDLHQAWLAGTRPVLVTKPSIMGYGCNWQHCHNMIFVGRSFSYELWYQAVRRCWRFGQTRPVDVHLIVAEGEDQIGRVIDRKGADHARMKAAMAAAMKRATGRRADVKTPFIPTHKGALPAWLTA